MLFTKPAAAGRGLVPKMATWVSLATQLNICLLKEQLVKFPPQPQPSFTFSNWGRGGLQRKSAVTSVVPVVTEAAWGCSFKDILGKMMLEGGALFLSSKNPTVCCFFKGLGWSKDRRMLVSTILLGLLYSQEINLF